MRSPFVDEHVALLRDIPELGLYFGDVGVVRGITRTPRRMYEVEFQSARAGEPVRARLTEEAVRLAPLSPFDPQPGTDRNLYF